MKRILLILLLSPILCLSQGAIPSSGPVSMRQIALTQVVLGEMSPLILDQSFTLAELNSYSHLSDKTPPFKISDWHGYTGTFYSMEVDTILIRNNCPSGYTPSYGRYMVPSGAYTSTISVDSATALAQADVDTYAQSFINGSPVGGAGIGYAGSCVSGSPTLNGVRSDYDTSFEWLYWWGNAYVISDYDVRSDISVNVTIEFGNGLIINRDITIGAYHHRGRITYPYRSIKSVVINSITPLNDGVYTYFIR